MISRHGPFALAFRVITRSDFEAEVTAGAIVATLECAVRQWVSTGGRVPLARILRQAFVHLAGF